MLEKGEVRQVRRGELVTVIVGSNVEGQVRI